MIKHFFILTLAFAPIVSLAQINEDEKEYASPYYVDELPSEYKPSFIEGNGYYYDDNGVKLIGEIEIMTTSWVDSYYRTAYLNFKDENDEWWIIEPEGVQSIVLNCDSFIVAQNLIIDRTWDKKVKERLTVENEFLEVIETGKMKLFKLNLCCKPIQRSSGNGYSYTTYIQVDYYFAQKKNGPILLIKDDGKKVHKRLNTTLLLNLISDNEKQYLKLEGSRYGYLNYNFMNIIKEYNKNAKKVE